MNDKEFIALLRMMRGTEPYPTGEEVKTQEILYRFMDKEAKKRGYNGWIAAEKALLQHLTKKEANEWESKWMKQN